MFIVNINYIKKNQKHINEKQIETNFIKKNYLLFIFLLIIIIVLIIIYLNKDKILNKDIKFKKEEFKKELPKFTEEQIQKKLQKIEKHLKLKYGNDIKLIKIDLKSKNLKDIYIFFFFEEIKFKLEDCFSLIQNRYLEKIKNLNLEGKKFLYYVIFQEKYEFNDYKITIFDKYPVHFCSLMDRKNNYIYLKKLKNIDIQNNISQDLTKDFQFDFNNHSFTYNNQEVFKVDYFEKIYENDGDNFIYFAYKKINL